MKPENLFPYLVTDPPPPEAADLAVPVGHGLYAVLFEDEKADSSLAHTLVTPADLGAAGLTAEQAHRAALENLDRFAEADPRLTIQKLGGPGQPAHLLLYSDHPRAAACLRLPDLYEHSREVLRADALWACVPQRESLVIAPDRGPADRERLLAKLREAEAGAEHPLSFGVFLVTPEGVRPVPG